MIPAPFDAITRADIETLIQQQVRENRTLEYKEALPGDKENDKKEFLRDVASFANGNGGDLLFGIREAREGGKPAGVPAPANVGLDAINIDAAIRRLDDIVTYGIAPRITGIRIRAVEGFAAGPVIVLRVPRSWAAPHMVTYQSRSPFTIRRAASRIDMDVTDLRAAFLAQATLGERIETLRAARLDAVLSGATGLEALDVPLVVVHVVPLAAMDPLASVNLVGIGKETTALQPMRASGWDSRYNFDGFMTYAQEASGGLRSYTQLFRSGVAEAAGAAYATPEHKALRVAAIETEIFGVVARVMGVQRRLGVESPTSILMTLANVQGYRFITENPYLQDCGNRPIDRAVLLLPDVLITEFPADATVVSVALQPALNALWQAAGFPRALDYSDSGDWRPDRR